MGLQSYLFIRKLGNCECAWISECQTPDALPLPKIADLLDCLGRARFFYSLDLANAYHQVSIKAGDEYLTAFSTNESLFEYIAISFGHNYCPSIFQRLLNFTFTDLLAIFVLVYLDDLLIYNSNQQEYLSDLRTVLLRLKEKNYKIKRQTCVFGAALVIYLGYIVWDGTIMVDPKKIEAISTWPIPTSVKEVHQFVGQANYYNHFIQQFAEIATTLTNLLSSKKSQSCGPDEQKAFEILQSALCSAPILRLPDFNLPFAIKPDGSENSIGATLIQKYDGKLQPIAFSQYEDEQC